MLNIDGGKAGKLPVCVVCWTGLAACMTRDFHIFTDFNKDYLQEMNIARQREEYVKNKGGKK
jgi:hypothetical protein